MPRHTLISALPLIAALAVPAAEQDLLIHWSFNEGAGATAHDGSANALHGTVDAQWTDSPSGKALLFDGQPEHIVQVRVPPQQRFGSGSWTFMACIKPIRMTIEDRQNQRRLFAFGTYPQAYLVIDLMGNGQLSCYFCYGDEAGTTVSTGASATSRVKTNEWAHVALVCDRMAGRIYPYINGYCQGAAAIRTGFAGDFSVDGLLTVGSHWHNYWGVMDEVKIYRRALRKDEIKSQFAALKSTFAITVSPEAKAAERREELQAALDGVGKLWQARDFGGVRNACRAVLAEPWTTVPPQYRSYAHLRTAQSYEAENNTTAARTVYEAIAATEDYPEAHRFEARERLKAMTRVSSGLTPRDPAASRTRVPLVNAFAAEVFIAPDGDDAAPGTAERPFASLTRARNAVRRRRANGVTGPIAVTLLPGEYRITETLELTEEDSGTDQSPVVYRAAEKGRAVLYGGRRLSGFQPVSDRAMLKRLPAEAHGHVLQCNLRAQGITDYGELKVRGFGQPPSPPTLELYVNRVPMTLARWPNSGFVGIRKLIQAGSKTQGTPSVFEYDSDRHARWTQATDAWLFGYFHFLWADATIKVGRIDTAARTITTAQPYHYGGRGMSTRQGIAYYALNLLEEIDTPGEWYLDRETGILTLYPPSDAAQATIEIGMLSVPMITVHNAAHIRIEGLVFDLARYNCMRIEDSEHCLVAGCTVSRMAGNGITIRGGRSNGILGCDIHAIGRRATEVIGGDRETLTPAGHFVENCRIHSQGRIDRTYTPAIQLEGVGNRVAHNLMYDSPSSVMRIEGNDHIIEFNEVHSAVRESDDQGAMELFRNSTYRGVVFRYNHIHNCGKTGTEHAVHGQAGIRFDDAISGMLVYGNLFVRCANGKFGAIQMNSGRDNVMDNNIFVDCKQGLSGGWRAGNKVWKTLRAGQKLQGFYTNELYLERYPKIATMLDEPAVNHVWRNVFYRCGVVATGGMGNLDMMANAVFPDTNPGFVDPANGDFRIRPDAALIGAVGFSPIPVDEIGLYNDRYRASWPVATAPVSMPDWR